MIPAVKRFDVRRQIFYLKCQKFDLLLLDLTAQMRPTNLMNLGVIYLELIPILPQVMELSCPEFRTCLPVALSRVDNQADQKLRPAGEVLNVQNDPMIQCLVTRSVTK